MRAAPPVLALALLLGAGCQGGSELRPPEVHYGQDICTVCGMIVSEERFAAAAAPAKEVEEPPVFDDIGCLFRWDERNPDGSAVLHWVHDFESREWVPAETAHFVRSADIRSPMGSGVLATSSRSRAEELRKTYPGEVLSWSELREIALTVGLIAPPKPGES